MTSENNDLSREPINSERPVHIEEKMDSGGKATLTDIPLDGYSKDKDMDNSAAQFLSEEIDDPADVQELNRTDDPTAIFGQEADWFGKIVEDIPESTDPDLLISDPQMVHDDSTLAFDAQKVSSAESTMAKAGETRETEEIEAAEMTELAAAGSADSGADHEADNRNTADLEVHNPDGADCADVVRETERKYLKPDLPYSPGTPPLRYSGQPDIPAFGFRQISQQKPAEMPDHIPASVPNIPSQSIPGDSAAPDQTQLASPGLNPDSNKVSGSATSVSATAAEPASARKKLDPAERNIKTCLASIWLYLASQMGVFLALSIPLGFLMAALGMRAFGEVEAWSDISTNALMLIVSILSCVIVCLYAIPRTKVRIKKELRESRYKKSDLFMGVCAAYALSIPLGFVTMLLSYLLSFVGLGIPEAGNSTATTMAGEVLYVITAVIAAPICEEVIFRGIMLDSLKKYGPAFALVFSSLLFGLAHMNLYQGIGVMGVGLAMGFMYLKTGSLQASVFIHFINNFIAVFSSYVPMEWDWILEVALLVMMGIGWWYYYANRSMIKALINNGSSTTRLWSMTGRQISFWLFAALFAVMSAASILTGI